MAINSTSGKVVNASGVDTTRCIRYAVGYFDGGLLPDLPPSGGDAWQQPVRPPLDMRGCQQSVFVVATASQEVVLQVSAAGNGCWGQPSWLARSACTACAPDGGCWPAPYLSRRAGRGTTHLAH